MPMDRFLIAPLNSGLQTDLRPFLIPEDAFESLFNAYVFRGRVRKRFGGVLMGYGWPNDIMAPYFSRLRINIGTTDGSGNFSGIVPGSIFKAGQAFTVGTSIFTVYVGTPGSHATLAVDTDGVYTPSGAYDITSGGIIISNAAPLSDVYFYPAEPVMGIDIFQQGTYNDQPTYAFDTQFAYVFSGGFWQQSGTITMGVLSPQWHGNDLNFFCVTNWQGTSTSQTSPTTMIVSNFHANVGSGMTTDDYLWAYDGTNWTNINGATGFYFNPGRGNPPQTGPKLVTARLLVVFKERLLALDTIENDGGEGLGINTQYKNRLRYSINGTPFAQNSWYENGASDNSGLKIGVGAGAGVLDAYTQEEIISAEFIKDRLIVFFQQSTWEIVYTGNQLAPFAWQKINTELGSEAQQSTIPFDKEILTMSNVGVHSCNGANVQRIDDKIPDEVFEIQDAQLGIKRVAGIRDYFVECAYWSFPSDDENTLEKYPNRVLVYNYRNNTWSLNDDCVTAWGYFQQGVDQTWANQDCTWEEANFAWNSGINQAQFRQTLAGNQEGFVFQADSEVSRNAPVMQLSNATISSSVITLTITDHTLQASDISYNGDYICIENAIVSLGATDGSGNASGNTTGSIGDIFIIGASTFTVISASGALEVSGTGTGTFDTVSGAYTFTGAPATTTILFIGSGLNLIYPVDSVQDANTVTVIGNFTGTYVGAGTITRVSNIQVASKQWNPYLEQGTDLYLARIDFGIQRTGDFGDTNAVTVDYYPSSADYLSMIQEGQATGSIMGNGTLELTPYDPSLYPLESVQERLWHPIYFQTTGECIQIFIYLTDPQMRDVDSAFSNFQLEGMVLHTSQTSSRLE